MVYLVIEDNFNSIIDYCKNVIFYLFSSTIEKYNNRTYTNIILQNHRVDLFIKSQLLKIIYLQC